ncbi:enhanced level of genomic instability 1 [Euwallacea similis]|uniref:enhanced level of genomic instability 1 n=1 Tax=Euwallacea similis TaxID=1736056 RepID=UPI00344E53F8
MKDITSYFSSPSKTINPSSLTNFSPSVASQEPIQPINPSTLEIETKVISNSELRTDDLTEKGTQRKIKKKKNSLKFSDPKAKNVAKLHSSRLNLISHNTSGIITISQESDSSTLESLSSTGDGNGTLEGTSNLGSQAEAVNTFAKENLDNHPLITKNNLEELDESKFTPKINAFQFLMNSRNNIIGSNSEGKPFNKLENAPTEEKSKLKARKSLFEDWANEKGASKRLRDDEDIEQCINQKLEKRAKRLKKLLHAEKLQTEKKKVSKSKRNTREISSSTSECIVNDVLSNLKGNIESKEMVDEDAQDTVISKVESSKKKQRDSNLLNFHRVIDNTDKEDIIEIYQEPQLHIKEVIKIKMFTPQCKKKESSLMRKRKLCNTSDVINDNCEKSELKGLISKYENNPQSQPSLNDSLEDFCPVESDCLKMNINSKETKQSKKNVDKERQHNFKKNSNVSKKKQKDSTDELPKPAKRKKLVKNVLTGVDSVNNSSIPTQNKFLCTEKAQETFFEKGDEDTINVHVNKIKEIDVSSIRRTLRKREDINYREVAGDLKNISHRTKKYKHNNELPSRKKSRKSNKDNSIEKIELSSDDSDSICDIGVMKTTPKMAPVFLKATPKPKITNQVIEARKKFLMSGIPDSLKKTVERRKRIEEKDFDTFPLISHVQQKCDNPYWSLPEPTLNYKEISTLQISTKHQNYENLVIRNIPYEINLTTEMKKVKHLKSFLYKIKTQNPNYPVYKVFKHVYEKSGKSLVHNNTNSKKNLKRHLKKLERKSEVKENDGGASVVSKNHEMWPEKYKPKSTQEIIGNYHSVQELKKWLEMWKNYSQEINAKSRKGVSGTSESEFETSDCDSRDSSRLPGNTMILYGPNGSGKTSAVYATAYELKLNVLELNASTKRTGKKLLQELQEATQSHQVRKSESPTLSKFINSSTSINVELKTTNKPNEKNDKLSLKGSKKMCILLIEDIDLIFEQDEGFLSSLCQLIMTSKRPIILTTTDNSAPHVQKFISQYECVSFQRLSMHCLAVWLQIVCLVEGMLVDKRHLGNLLEYNKGDIRKTLLEVQFWCQSGGQRDKCRVFPIKTDMSGSVVDCDLEAIDDELQVEIKEDECDNAEYFTHKNCLGSFEIFRVNKEFCLPEKIDLGTIWWNLPNIMNSQSNASERLKRQKGLPFKKAKYIPESSSEANRLKLKSAMQIYDSLIMSDCLLKNTGMHHSNEPVIQSWHFDVLNSIELSERKEDYVTLQDSLSEDISHNLLNGCIESYEKIEGTSNGINMSLPDACERRWRANIHLCEHYLKESLPISNILERKSVSLDYLPALREITRLEEKRADSNTKRQNRFRHYFKELSLDFNPTACKLACTILNLSCN